jgi:hypothetical protein
MRSNRILIIRIPTTPTTQRGKSKLDGIKQQIGDKQQELDRLKARLGELGAAPEACARDMRPDRAVAIKILPVQLLRMPVRKPCFVPFCPMSQVTVAIDLPVTIVAAVLGAWPYKE